MHLFSGAVEPFLTVSAPIQLNPMRVVVRACLTTVVALDASWDTALRVRITKAAMR